MNPMTTQAFETRWARITARVAAAAAAAGRDPAHIRVIAVGKRFPASALAVAHAVGVRDFGENYISELAGKATQLPPDIRWHLIGPVQRRAVPRLRGLDLVVHSLDRLAVVDRFVQAMPDALPPFLVQVNIAGEPQKSGVAPQALPAFVDALLSHAARPRLLGLMAIPPATTNPEHARPHFAALRVLGERLAAQTGQATVELSMGMTADFAVAITEGATMVRIGTALFGLR